MSDQQENELGATKGTRVDFPIAKSVRGKIAVIAGVLLVPAVLSIGLNSSADDRAERDAEVISLMSNYPVDDASIYKGGWSGADGSIPGKYTLHITKDGSTHSCRQVTVESLRAQEPIKCDGGTVITPKVVPAAEER